MSEWAQRKSERMAENMDKLNRMFNEDSLIGLLAMMTYVEAEKILSPDKPWATMAEDSREIAADMVKNKAIEKAT